jgi:replicative DNA helicase
VFNKYNKYIYSLDIEPELEIIFNLITKYYDAYEHHEYIGLDEFKTFFNMEYPKKKDAPIYLSIIEQVYSIDTSDSIANDLIQQLVEIDCANRVVKRLMPTMLGESFGVMPSIIDIVNDWAELAGKTEEEDSPFITTPLEELISMTATDGLQWRLNCLKQALGPLSGGTLGHVFARVETGKTAFLHSEVSYMVKQLEDQQTALWFNNEEAGYRVRLRQFSAVCGASEADIKAQPKEAQKAFDARGGNRIILYDDANISVETVERVMREHKPRFVVIDQGDKLSYRGDGKAGNGADRLKGIYDKLREVVKRCNKEWKTDILTVGQADAAAEGRKWLHSTNLDSGKTGKPGAFDYIIGIGKTHDGGDEYSRYISLCKNKLTSSHGKYVVTINTDTARYID